MSKLPLKIKVGVRDLWSKPETRVQQSASALKTLTGIGVELEPDWSLLHAELGPLHPDLETLVPSVAYAAEAFCLALTARLNEDEEWADTFLETVEGRIRLAYDIGRGEPSLSWDAPRTGFVIMLPKSRVASFSELEAVCSGAMAGDPFSETPKAAAELADRTVGDDWADVSVDRTTGQPSLAPEAAPAPRPAASAGPARPVIDRLPDLALLSRPDELLREPPYHLAVYSGHGTVEIHGSHSPTLELLAAYLQKFVRTNHYKTTKPPGVEIKLHQSSFGPGVIYDKVTMDATPHAFTVSPMIVLPLIESRLGYEPVDATGSSWTYRRNAPFKR